jgi:hypothetical protein
MSAALLTEAEMREAIEDETSPYYLDDRAARTIALAVATGIPAEVAFAVEYGFQHIGRVGGRRPLADRMARWTR